MEEQKEEVVVKREQTSVGYTREKAPVEFIDGFSLRTVIGAFFVGFVMMPASIYLGLVAGTSLGDAAQWVTIILFSEVVRRSFGTLKKQELYMLYYIAGSLIGFAGGLALSGGVFSWMIWNQYVISSPTAEKFRIVEYLKAEGVNWIAPFPGSEALINRTFFHKDWIPAIVLMVILNVLARMNWLGLGYFAFRVTSDFERLPFPMAPIAAQGATALAEVNGKRETWRWRVFSIGSVIGVAFGLIYILVPTFSGAIFNKPFQILPIPFIDLTTNTEGILPAALTGLNTELGSMMAGFVIPYHIVLGMFISSVICQIGLNPVLYNAGILHTWRKGMGSIPTSMANSLDFWLSISIGTALTIAILGIFNVVKAFTKKKNAGERGSFAPVPGRGDFPIKLALGLWLASTLGYIIVCHKLVPLFPIWLFVVYGFIWTPLNTYISARMIGLTGGGVGFPYLKEATFILSGYKGVAIWWAPVPLFDHGWAAQRFREVELTGTKIMSVIKAEIFMFPVMLLCSLIFWSFIWKLGPIPSAIYPYATKFWPLHAMYQCLWSTATVEKTSWMLQAIQPKWILLGLGTGGILYGITAWMGAPILFFYGLLGGMGGWPHYTIPLMFGGLLGKYVFTKQFGQEKWRAFAPVLVAGYACGMGLTGMCGIAIALISKAVYQMPF
ncbi:peptide transporter [Candidatus Desantisbacteria bacterium CG_4_10_14_0_8_um_filter_48_22]|uniref:Peptide transporter n=1 Tax=Candidatus Desantisbacteria bacterium CG_4_10_14_0_8_um_filter_48_22 TaxID=1974543 RepID=A0A2M7S675_9BACT|nr:MAG: hypothetical protein AUJ67_00110 [Candidatus Desantisbacteria bacterium CG1_02_49_89]PIV56815.1 MAG: peptide transporter [Candidatus Desantisbacteria bacterium CG02_land_8_20_14_3_00_49_13]PIZ15032.1 MAG: peptide transporter [Candidatus Desantisbacteria bacterium CG_4_10_14_0_8_um_filter_48_22]PJB53942.1 MAG: peptide transporter [Bdellovibrio sp. CG_4_9_14_3_um_filter_39_7]